MKGPIRVLLVDDHPVVRVGLRDMLMSEPGIEVVGEASSGEEACQKADELEPNVIFMDLRMPGMGGNEATRWIKKKHPTMSVIVLTMYNSEMYVVEAIRCGAAGFLTKDASRELLCHTVQAVVDGGTLVRSTLLRQAIQSLRHVPREAADDDVDRSTLSCLSSRELDVLRLLARGYGNKTICAELNLAEVTVKKHVQNVIGKLGVSDRTHAAIVGVRLGLVA